MIKVFVFSLVMMPSMAMAQTFWTDVTTDENGQASSCQADPDRCANKFNRSGLVFTKPAPEKMTLAEAGQFCRGLTYNGTTGWRLPTFNDFRYTVVIEGLNWSAADVKKSFWVSDWFGGGEVADAGRGVVNFSGDVIPKDPEAKGSVVCVQQALVDYWVDVTTDDANQKSTCAESPERCTYEAPNGLMVTRLIGQADWYTAQGASQSGCAGLNHNGVGGWRLPEFSELYQIVRKELYRLPGLSLDASSGFWSAQTDSRRGEYAMAMSVMDTAGRGIKLRKTTSDVGYVCVKSN
jgi:hypothetical protein